MHLPKTLSPPHYVNLVKPATIIVTSTLFCGALPISGKKSTTPLTNPTLNSTLTTQIQSVTAPPKELQFSSVHIIFYLASPCFGLVLDPTVSITGQTVNTVDQTNTHKRNYTGFKFSSEPNKQDHWAQPPWNSPQQAVKHPVEASWFCF